MFSILIMWFLSSVIFLTFGKISVVFFSPAVDRNNYGFCDLFLIGASIVGSLLSLLSIWIPINGAIMGVLLIIAACYNIYLYRCRGENMFSLLYKRLVQLPVVAQVAIVIAFAVVMFYSLLPPLIIDTWLYHMQSIIWNESFAVVPGIANLHGRFGFNSNFLLLSSAFSLNELFGFRLYNLLGLLMFVFLCWIVVRMVRHNTYWGKFAFAFLGFSFLVLYKTYLSSPSTDLFPNIMVAYVLFTAVSDKNALKLRPLLYWVLPVFSLTLKLSVIPVCLLSLLLFIELYKYKQYKMMLVYCGLALLIIVPWCIRNYYITGYIIFPYPSIDFFDVDWKVPSQFAEIEKGYVSSWAKMPGFSLAEFESMPSWEWVKYWLVRHYRTAPFFFCIFLLMGFSFILFCVSVKRKTVSKEQIINYIIALVGVLFWFFMAPDFRFGLGFVCAVLLIPLMLFNSFIGKLFLHKGIQYIFIIGILYLAVGDSGLYTKYMENKPVASFLYSPQSIDNVDLEYQYDGEMFKKYVSYKSGNITLYRPQFGQLCYDGTFPCMISQYETVEPRGDKIEDGFRRKMENKK